MKRLLGAIIWDLRLQVRYQIVTVGLIIAMMYTLVFLLLVPRDMENVLTVLIFSDPAMLGFVFIGVLVLFEQHGNTLEAIVVSPLTITEYLLSKILSLGIIAMLCSLLIAIAGHGWKMSFGLFLFTVLITSCIFTLIGFVCACRVNSFNQYIILTPIILAPAILPLLNFFGITQSRLLHLIPTQASLDLIMNALNREHPVSLWMALCYLSLWLAFSFWVAHRSFRRHLIIRHQS